MEDDLDTRIDSRLKEHKNEMLSEIKTLLQISTNTSTSEISKLSNKLLNADIPKFRRKSNEEQYKLNVKVIGKLDEVEQANSLEQAKFLTKEAADQLLHRQKLILLADSSELGWRVVQEYETNPLADDSDDEKRIFKAEARATRKFKAERGRRGRGRFTPYSRTGKAANGAGQTQEKAFGQTSGNMKPGLCFGCGKPGHWKKECLGTSNNKISSLLYSNKSESLNTVDETCGVEFDRGEPVKVASPVGRLRLNYSKWSSTTSDAYILDVVENGYKLPFLTLPEGTLLKNNRSALSNKKFVAEEIESLLIKGVIREVSDAPFIVNPLTVAVSKVGKLRLVLDCRHINSHLHLFKVKFEDIRVAEFLFKPGSYVFTYDLKSAYHHINIYGPHRKYLGFAWDFGEKTRYFVYCSLPFGLCTAGHIFTKILRVVVAYMRSLGHKIIMFLDDGIGGNMSYSAALNSSKFVQTTILDFGFLIAQEKCSWEPKQLASWLGYVLDFKVNKVFIKEDRILKLERSIERTLQKIAMDNAPLIGVKELASVVGQIISLQFVLGSMVQMRTRHMYNCILKRASWNSPIWVSKEAIEKLNFWKANARPLNNQGKGLNENESSAFFIYCDASAGGYGGYIVENESTSKQVSLLESDSEAYIKAQAPVLPEVSDGKVSVDDSSTWKLRQKGYCSFLYEQNERLPEVSILDHDRNKVEDKTLESKQSKAGVSDMIESNYDSKIVGSWTESESEKSSTWRETEAVRRVIRSNIEVLKEKRVKILSDNKNTTSILLKGSKCNDIHSLASDIAHVCSENNILISSQWIPRVNNVDADTLSRCGDSDGWFISSKCFKFLDDIWGTHTIDRVSSTYNTHCKKFNSRWWVPETDGIDAFCQIWSFENNWLVPPPRLIMKCICKMETDKAKGTLVVPYWPSADFWTCINENGNFKTFILEHKVLSKHGTVCAGKGPNLANVLYDRLHTAGCPESMDTANRMAGYLLKSRADSTTDKYSSYFKAFERFCLSRYLVCNPANSMSVALSITYLIDSDKSYSVISASVYAIKWKHSLYGRADPTDDSVVRNLLEAAKRLKSRPTVKKDVINAQTLIDLCLLFKDNKELVNIRDLAMILVCFAGFLRFNEMKNLLCSDVNFYNDHFTLKIRSSKTDMYREGSEIMIAKGTSVACPYLMLERYMNIASLKVGSDEFLFRPIYKSSGRYSLVKKNKGISYTRAKECISSKLSMVAPGLKLGTHSLRASGATVAANTKDISDRCIKRHGRWRSEKAKDGYIKDNIEKKLYITKCLGL